MKFISDLLMAALAVSAALVALSSPAAAQTAPDASTLPTEQPAGPDPAAIAAHERILRKVIADLMAKTPDYDSMVPQLADIVRANLDPIAEKLNQGGRLKTLTFAGSQQGALKFVAQSERGSTVWFIALTPEGKIAGLVFRDAVTPTPAN
ncbi:MAG: hypothetical protein K1X35_09815 [Caulobacteraceae bacterium]|nr:hypothetical protein [Caulobacteraceae bacterium]